MRLQSGHIKNFKRFTDLKISNLPETARLIVLAGPNGCGKSSFFDALLTWKEGKTLNQRQQNHKYKWDSLYHVKLGFEVKGNRQWMEHLDFSVSGQETDLDFRKIVYQRSAYRNEADFIIQSMSRQGDQLNQSRVSRMIDNDETVSRNYQRFAGRIFEDVCSKEDGSTTFEEYREKMLNEIRRHLCAIFPDLQLDDLRNPLEDGTFRFSKGESKGFPYQNLSGGEKAVFDLILDLLISQWCYDNTLICIDEPEIHLNARIQSDLLNALYEIVTSNESNQLIVATHSIGMMRKARDLEKQHPGTVVFLDFAEKEFDQPVEIEPVIPDRKFWNRIYDVALDDLSELVAPDRLVICEGSIENAFDAQVYGLIFEREFPETQFISVGGYGDVTKDTTGLKLCLEKIFSDRVGILSVIDRDDRSDNEIAEWKQKGIYVLNRRTIESYLLDDEVLRKLAEVNDQPEKAADLIQKREELAPDIRADKVKDIAGQVYTTCRDTLNLRQRGNDAKAFMRDTLAPLITEDMQIYQELKYDIFHIEHKTRQ